MDTNNSKNKVQVKISDEEDFFDLNLCAKEFLDFIDEFQIKFLEKKYFILKAHYNDILAGILVAEDKTNKVDSLKKFVPIIHLHLIYVNNQFRKKSIGKILLESFILIQKKNGMALINVKIPQKYRDGIKFFLKNKFLVVEKKENDIVLEINLWNDYGIRDCQIIEEDFNDVFS